VNQAGSGGAYVNLAQQRRTVVGRNWTGQPHATISAPRNDPHQPASQRSAIRPFGERALAEHRDMSRRNLPNARQTHLKNVPTGRTGRIGRTGSRRGAMGDLLGFWRRDAGDGSRSQRCCPGGFLLWASVAAPSGAVAMLLGLVLERSIGAGAPRPLKRTKSATHPG